MADRLKDEELEAFFKKGTDQHDYPFDNKAWEQMETLLDKDDKKRRLLWIILFGLITLSVSVIYYSLNSDSPFSLSDISEYSIATSDSDMDLIMKPSDPVENKSTVNVNSSSIEISSSAENYKASFNNNLGYSIKLPQAINYTDEVDEDDNGVSSVRAEMNGERPQMTIFEKAEDIMKEPVLLSYLPTLHLNSLHTNLDPLALPFIIVDRPSKVQSITSPSWMYGLNLAAETSWTPSGEYSNIDISAGLSISKFISPNILLGVQFNYINDDYVVGHTDYHTDPAFWENGEIPIYTDANAKILEFQIQGIFNFGNLSRSGFSAGIGINSISMLKESYAYHFEKPTDDFSSSWVQSGNTFAANLEFSIGWRLPLSNNTMLVMSPYTKLPTSAIGHGNIMLSSYGLRVRYSFIR